MIVAISQELLTLKGSLEAAVSWEMFPFDENLGEDAGWFRDGSRWDWWQIGGRWTGIFGGRDVIQIKHLDLNAINETRKGWLREAFMDNYRFFQEHGKPYPFTEVQPDETEEQFLERKLKTNPIHASAFLRNRHWHEADRMGWFGAHTYTECELKDMNKPKADPNAWFGKCLYKDEEHNARIVCWNEPYEIWSEEYYTRFVEPLQQDDTLVCVDYHV